MLLMYNNWQEALTGIAMELKEVSGRSFFY